MITHLVLFRPRAALAAPERERLADALRGVLQSIPAIRRARVGRRITHGRPYEQLMRTDYTHAALIDFDDLAGLQAYLQHPAHDVLAQRFFEAFEEALMYDYQLEEGVEGVNAMLDTAS